MKNLTIKCGLLFRLFSQRCNFCSGLLTLIIFLSALSAMGQVNTEWTAIYQSPFQQVDYGRKIKVDASGNVYVGGHSKIDDQGNSKVVILKYDAAGNLLWVYNNDSTTDIMEDMVMDNEGNIYYTGYRWAVATSEWNLLTVKVNISGDEVWSSTYDGNGFGLGWDYGMALTLDAEGNVYTVGYGAAVSYNGYDFEIVKYNNDGTQQWEANWHNPVDSDLSSNYFNEAYRVKVDDQGNLFVSGYTFNGVDDELTLLKFNTDGNLLWTKSYDTKANWPEIWDNRNFMKIDANDNIYMAGEVRDSTHGCDILLLKYDSTGALLWSKAWNSTGNDSDYVSGDFYDEEGLAFDNTGNIFVSGTITNPNTEFREDIVTLKYNPDGDLIWTNTFNGIGNDEDRPYSIATDNLGNVYVCGESANSHGIGTMDYITFKLDGGTGTQVWKKTFNGAADFYDEAHSIFVDPQNNVYVTGYSGTNNDPFNFHAEIVTIKYSQAPTGLNEIADQMNATIFPNPSGDATTLQLSLKQQESISIYVLNELGETVITLPEMNLQSGAHQLNFDTQRLPNGMYRVELVSDGNVQSENISVVHN